jgi:drug/metabolite transporter (DMT)-like permease
MSWVFLAFGSVFFFTVLGLLQRVLAVESKNARATVILFNTIAAITALVIFFISGSYKSFKLPTEPTAYLALLIAVFCYGMYERGRFYAAKLLDASVLTIVGNISVVVAFVGSLFLYNEKLTLTKLIGSLLIVGALFLVSLTEKVRKASRKGVIIALLINAILGTGWMLDKTGARYFNANTYSLLGWTIPLIFILFPLEKFSVIKIEFKNASWKIILLAVVNVIGYIMQLKALAIAEATRVIPIIQTYTLFTIALGIILLKEKEHLLSKIIAGILAMIGVYLLI